MPREIPIFIGMTVINDLKKRLINEAFYSSVNSIADNKNYVKSPRIIFYPQTFLIVKSPAPLIQINNPGQTPPTYPLLYQNAPLRQF